MKKIMLVVVATLVAGVVFAQKINITKGGEAASKFSTAAAYENFVEGVIKAKDENGNEYVFVKAEFTVSSKSGKPLQYTLSVPYFTGDQGGEVARASKDGAEYTFSNIVVKDKAGKEYRIPEARFEFTGFRNH